MRPNIIKTTISRLGWPFLVSLMLSMVSKAAPPSGLQKLKKGSYEENLAAYRVKWFKGLQAKKKETFVSLVCPLDQTNHLAQRLAKRKLAYEHMAYLKGYTIQLYIGSSRAAALKTQGLASAFAHTSKLHYRQPHYTVQLGFFSDRLEAYFVYLTLVKKIGTAMIRPSMLPREEYVANMLECKEPLLD